LFITPNANGDVEITGFAVTGSINDGFEFLLMKEGFNGRVILKDNTATSATSNRIFTPGGGPDYILSSYGDAVRMRWAGTVWHPQAVRRSGVQVNSTGTGSFLPITNVVQGTGLVASMSLDQANQKQNLHLSWSGTPLYVEGAGPVLNANGLIDFRGDTGVKAAVTDFGSGVARVQYTFDNDVLATISGSRFTGTLSAASDFFAAGTLHNSGTFVGTKGELSQNLGVQGSTVLASTLRVSGSATFAGDTFTSATQHVSGAMQLAQISNAGNGPSGHCKLYFNSSGSLMMRDGSDEVPKLIGPGKVQVCSASTDAFPLEEDTDTIVLAANSIVLGGIVGNRWEGRKINIVMNAAHTGIVIEHLETTTEADMALRGSVDFSMTTRGGIILVWRNGAWREAARS
jgi:hypothetical protein